jgi:hypothetical protein
MPILTVITIVSAHALSHIKETICCWRRRCTRNLLPCLSPHHRNPLFHHKFVGVSRSTSARGIVHEAVACASEHFAK